MDSSTLSAAVGMLAMLASGASIYVSLYVKACIGPIITRLDHHGRNQDQARVAQAELLRDVIDIGERVARLEAYSSDHRTRQERKT